MRFTIESQAGSQQVDILIDSLIIAGWAGRDMAAIEHHIQELEALGIKRPASTPLFYRVSASRLTQAGCVESTGPASSGEVEYLLVRHAGKIYVGVASDHTDREVEAYGVTVSKQMCDKPCAATLWPLDEVEGHWDSLQLRSRIREQGKLVTYQEGSVGALRTPADLLEKMAGSEVFEDGTAMLGGTLAVMGGIRPSDRFEYEIHDPVLGRTIAAAYDIRVLPVRG
ncbi:MAG: DUF2848 domain-containing protein [Pigmentiphaga sp.]|uniref:DUF2848 domain-containing protein n=1 Tax=Pigmentiphaga sp. TaxID=1977564 RepID=UPI0029B77FE4|nr:DUF2848 domain-containing protein [Pigmentiphaga sp.]MDX3904690.1 DUF2848 domain-containing protein [Pigmentiphaga sp.]